MANDDRVNELYRGEIFNREAQRICRDRIHWMCGQIRGKRVLDIGCSQGIATILAAREGHEVVGVDVEEPAIRFAKKELAQELPVVQERVRLVHADIHELDLGGERFDTVLLGEILEHQTNPRHLFERACQFLNPAGLLVAATPFGLLVHDDHKFTFYLSSLLATIEGLCRPASLEIVDAYFRFTARHLDAPGGPDLPPREELWARCEAAFLEKEWRAHETLTDRAGSIRRATEERDKLAAQVAQLEGHVRMLSEKLREERAAREELARQRKEQEEHKRLQSLAAATAKADQAVRSTPRPRKERIAVAAGPTEAHAGPTSTVRAGLDTLVRSIHREVESGRYRTEPVTALKKTYARVRRTVRGEPLPKPVEPTPPPSAAAKPTEPGLRFPPWVPEIAPVRSTLTIATILDEFSHHCFQYEAHLVALSKAGWKAEMEQHRPAFLFAESAWRGNQGQWRYLMTKYAQKEDNPLRDLLAWCKAQRVPTVFWNKEDPANFDVFKDVARDFDWVFTTDANCVPRYRELLGHDRVRALPFAAQPIIHNPTHDKLPRDGQICFAGSWRADKYPERAVDSEILLKPALPMGLDIYDRFHGSKEGDKLSFPEPYASAVRGSLDYDRMLTAYRAYKTFLNVNSVKDSPTMFSRRVFELLACGTPVVSTESEGIQAMFGSLVKIARSEQEARGMLERLLQDPDYRERFAHVGYREVLEHHTYAQRLQTVLHAVGLSNGAAATPVVSILAATNRPDRLTNLLGNVRRQIHPAIELVVLLNSDRYDRRAVDRQVANIPGTKVISLPESFTLADCLNHGIEHCSGSWIAKFDDDDYYGPHYLSDLLLATQYTDAAILGKRSFFAYLEGLDQMALRFPGHSHVHVHFVHGATLLIRRGVFDQVRFTPVQQGTDTIFQQECRAKGMRIYSTDPFNFVHLRHIDVSEHTWKITSEEFLTKCKILRKGLDLDLVMV